MNLTKSRVVSENVRNRFKPLVLWYVIPVRSSKKMSLEFDADTVSAPRLVQMARGVDGYGFNLHGERNIQAGQTISAVDDGGVAQKAGLRVGDKVIEVNGENVEQISHSDVVKRIKTNEKEVSMLVIDQTTAAYLKQEGRPVTADMANIMTVYVPKVSEPEVEVAATPPEISVESAVLEESTPPSNIDDDTTQVDSGEAEVAVDSTTPEEVKQLNEVLNNEQEKEQEEEATSSPAPEPEPQLQPQPVLNNGITPSSAPPSLPPGSVETTTTKPLRSTIKQTKHTSWNQKYKYFNEL